MTTHNVNSFSAGLCLSLTLIAASPAAAQVSADTQRPSGAANAEAEVETDAAPAAAEYPSAAAGDGATKDGYNLSRWAEDWRAMRDPAKRDDPLDRLKYLPLDGDGDIYLTLSGEARLRVNMTSNPNLSEGPHQRQDINRLVGGADLHVGPNLRFFGEVAHGGLDGRELGTPSASLRNDLTFQQYFAEASGEVAGVQIGARYGRQEFTDGPNLLLSQRDNNTIRYTLNGIRAWVRGSTLRADVFDFRPTAYGQSGTGDDDANDRQRFSGVTAGVVLPTDWLGGSKLYLDPFLWRRRNDAGTWSGRVGEARRYYGGAHLWGDVGPLTVDWTVNHQWGRYIDQDIDAWQALFAQTYRLGEGSAAPRIGFHADYASGGGGNGEGKMRNAFSPFGNNIYYSYQLSLTPSNLVAVAPNFSFTPVKKVRVTAEYLLAWRDTAQDAVYRANGSAFAGTQAVADRKIGDLTRLQVVWNITPRLSFTGRYEHLDAGPSLTKAGYTSSDFLAGWLSFRF